MKRIVTRKQKNTPLTLDALADYNQKVLIPAFEERFANKYEFRELKSDTKKLNNNFTKFKNESLKNQDAMLKKLDILLTEKEVREYQEKKEKRLWAIVLKALQEHRILSSKDIEAIARLDIF